MTLPTGSTITLTLSAGGTITAQGLAGSTLAGGKAHAYTLESAEMKLSGVTTAITLSHQRLSALDIRQARELTELRYVGNNLTKLNPSFTKRLQHLDCTFNQLEQLNMPKASALKELRLKGNYVKSLDLDQCLDLGVLDYADNHYPAFIDLSKCLKLQQLDLAKNQFRPLDLSHNGALHSLSCGENEISSLNLAYLSSLEHLSIASCSNLSKLTLGEQSKLRYLDPYGAGVRSLDFSKFPLLEELSCVYGQLASLGLSHNQNLRILSCARNPFAGLDISHCLPLEKLNCGDLQIEFIDLSHNPKLVSLRIGHNNLSRIDLFAQKKLRTLCLFYNNIGKLDLSAQTHLKELLCNDDQFSSITLSASAPPRQLDIYDNQIKESQVAQIIAQLPNCTEQTRGLFKVVNSPSALEGNVRTKALVEQALGKYWRVVNCVDSTDSGNRLDCRGSDAPKLGESVIEFTFDKAGGTVQLTVGGLGLLESAGATKPITSSKDLATYTLEGNELTIHEDVYKLIVSGTTIQAVELTKATCLRELKLYDHQLVTITLAGLPNLVSSRLHDSQLTSIQLSGMPLLNCISCYSNKLTVETGENVIASLPKRLEAERAIVLWLNSKDADVDNAFAKELQLLAQAKGWMMSDYLDGSKEDTGASTKTPTFIHPIVPVATRVVQIRLTTDTLQISATPRTSIVLYDLSGQLQLQTETDTEGLRELPLTACPADLYILAIPSEAVKVVIP